MCTKKKKKEQQVDTVQSTEKKKKSEEEIGNEIKRKFSYAYMLAHSIPDFNLNSSHIRHSSSCSIVPKAFTMEINLKMKRRSG